jgi:hypothetical protein
MAGRDALELETLTIRIPMRLKRRGGRKLIEGVAAPAQKPRRDETLVKTLVRAHRWRRRIESGQAKSITDLAEQEGVTIAYVCRLLPLTCLAPDIVEALLDGRQPKGLKLLRCWGTDRRIGKSSERTGGSAIDIDVFRKAVRLPSSIVALSIHRGRSSRTTVSSASGPHWCL